MSAILLSPHWSTPEYCPVLTAYGYVRPYYLGSPKVHQTLYFHKYSHLWSLGGRKVIDEATEGWVQETILRMNCRMALRLGDCPPASITILLVLSKTQMRRTFSFWFLLISFCWGSLSPQPVNCCFDDKVVHSHVTSYDKVSVHFEASL